MTDHLPDLVAAWEAWDARPSDPHVVAVFHETSKAWAKANGVVWLYARSEMARMRRKRPQPDRAAVLAAIVAGTDQ